MNGVKWVVAMLAALPAWGCTFICGEDIETRNGFTVEVRFQGKPLAGATIEMAAHKDLRTTTFTTGSDGKATIKVLEGQYFLTARKFGIVVGSNCGIHVFESRGKRSVTYEWKDAPEPVARISGRFSHQIYGIPELTPLPSWKMTLHAIEGPTRQATVAADGTFDFGSLPAGLYTLEVPAAEGARPILLRLDAAAKRRDLDLVLGGGLCGAASVLFRDFIEAPV